MGIFSKLFSGKDGRLAAMKQEERIRDGIAGSEQRLDDAYGQVQGLYEPIQGRYQSLADIGNSANELYGNAMGMNGVDGNQAAISQFQSSPAYQFEMDQGLNALERRAAAQGRLQSGQTGLDTLSFAQGMANQNYNQYLNNLKPLMQQGNQGLSGLASLAGSQANVASGFGQQKANNYMNSLSQIGQAQAGGQMAGTNAAVNGFNALTGVATGLANIGGMAAGYGGFGR